MKKLSLVAAVFAVAASPAFANNVPVPSFNDFPEAYTHPTLGERAQAAADLDRNKGGARAERAQRSASEGRTVAPRAGWGDSYAPIQHGPEVTVSSGA
jgi:opacity protein-like surface antigen